MEGISLEDALLAYYILTTGPSSSYAIAKDLEALGVYSSTARSGLKAVVRRVDSRLQRLARMGFFRKDGNKYVPTGRLYLDDLRVVGRIISEEMGPVVVFDFGAYYVLFAVEDLLSEFGIEVGEQRIVGFTIKTTSV